MEKIVFGIFYVIGMGLKLLLFGTIRLVGYGIRKHKENAPPATITFNDNLRFEHTLITCGSGWGKTQLLQKQILEELPAVLAGERSVVVIDSQGDMIQKILHLAELTPFKEQAVEEPQPVSVVQQAPPEKPPRKRLIKNRFLRGMLITIGNLLLIAYFFLIAVFIQAFLSKQEAATSPILFTFGLITVGWYSLIRPISGFSDTKKRLLL
jgi:hypothetical protein